MVDRQTLSASPPPQERVSEVPTVVLAGVRWETFKALLADLGEDRACRIAYERGLLEIRMPLEEHEEPKRLIESFVEAIAAVRLFRTRIKEILHQS
jgi:hypothetical protein